MIGYEDEDEIKELLLGRRVVRVEGDESLHLDDGTVLTIHPNEGCGGCGNGWYNIDELNACPVNAIMNVEFEEDWIGENQVIRVFVFAQDERIKLLEVSGYDNGYYGTGYWIEVEKP